MLRFYVPYRLLCVVFSGTAGGTTNCRNSHWEEACEVAAKHGVYLLNKH